MNRAKELTDICSNMNADIRDQLHLYMDGVLALANETDRPTFERKFRMNSRSHVVKITPLAIRMADGGGIVYILEHQDGDPVSATFDRLNRWVDRSANQYDIPSMKSKNTAIKELANEVRRYVESCLRNQNDH